MARLRDGRPSVLHSARLRELLVREVNGGNAVLGRARRCESPTSCHLSGSEEYSSPEFQPSKFPTCRSERTPTSSGRQEMRRLQRL